MITGTGIDIVNIRRISKSIDEHGMRFIEKILSRAEIEKIPAVKKEEYIAGRFAAKEAFIKAAGMFIQFTGITILNDDRGKPFLAAIPSDNIDPLKVHISISHDTDYAAASVIIES